MQKKILSTVDWDNPMDSIQHISNWVLPQVSALLGSKLPLKKGSNGLYNASEIIPLWGEFLDNSYLSLDNELGSKVLDRSVLGSMLKVLTHSPRGDILPKKSRQYSKEYSRYSTLVPLLLAAFKQYRGIPYSSWNWFDPKLNRLVESRLVETVTFPDYTEWTKEQLLEFRETAQTIKSGSAEGQKKSILATTSISGVPQLKSYPALARVMLCQVWLAHPSVRNEYMILDPRNLDSLPEPLVDSEVLIAPSTAESLWD